MRHDKLCKQKYQPYENDDNCRDCDIIFKARRESYNRGFEDGIEYAKDELENHWFLGGGRGS